MQSDWNLAKLSQLYTAMNLLSDWYSTPSILSILDLFFLSYWVFIRLLYLLTTSCIIRAAIINLIKTSQQLSGFTNNCFNLRFLGKHITEIVAVLLFLFFIFYSVFMALYLKRSLLILTFTLQIYKCMYVYMYICKYV